MYTYVTVSVQPTILLSFPKVKNSGKPTWRRLVEAVENPVGGNHCALAQKIARDHPGEPGNHIHQFVKPYERSSYLYTALLNPEAVILQFTYTDVPR